MCSVVVLRRSGHPWPLILGANRDERLGRPWRPPARHWPDRTHVVGGMDEIAGGSWMAVNDDGVVACVLNREGTLGTMPGKRSRGELVLDALDHADAAAAARALVHLDPRAWRPFNLMVADNRDAFFLSVPAEGARVRIEVLPEGVSMITARELNDDRSPRIRFYRPLFAGSDAPDPDAGRWDAWQGLLGSRIWDGDAGPTGAMCVVTDTGFGTVCSALLALPAMDREGARTVWRFCPGRPDQAGWKDLDLA
ncbi:MAG TPA: NRDE family protein [Azospirillaceae bacterium]|nr:NRDE family protein [Azospirillaceae bacterium]